MGVGRNHDVTCGVRKQVEENKVGAAPVQNQVLAIPDGVPAMHLAEHAALAFHPFADVAKAPGTPEVVHNYVAPGTSKLYVVVGSEAGGASGGAGVPAASVPLTTSFNSLLGLK